MRRPTPTTTTLTLSKAELLEQLSFVDATESNKARVLQLEIAFRRKVTTHTLSLTAAEAAFRKFNTSPFVLLIHAFKRHYSEVGQIERDILPAKQFSSIETSAGRMVEEVVLPIYGWQCVASVMHSTNSALDGRLNGSNPYQLVTLKSGPRCLNDEMSENFADAILGFAKPWAAEGGGKAVDFTYGVLYGTPKQSNKKDWHILRKLCEKASARRHCRVVVKPTNQWSCQVVVEGVSLTATVRIGLDWWLHLGGPYCLMEVMTALIRSCIVPSADLQQHVTYAISDFPEIVGVGSIPDDYNVGLLQRSQLPWLFLVANHFCDVLI
jgi:hypothetical protein